MFIDVIPEDEAEGELAEIYAGERDRQGFVPSYTKVFSHHPEVYRAWAHLITSIRGQMDLRRCELATLAAARTLRSSCCAVAHGKVLRDRFYDHDTVVRLVTDHHQAGLDEVDVAVMDFAEKVTEDATSITVGDVQQLRGFGLTDRDILDVVLAVAARCFFATVIEALGALPEPELAGALEPDLRDALMVGRRTD